jgi:glycosyltransferase involved in cell wall biosynthesis
VRSITVGIPTLNRTKFLKETVLSVISNSIINIDEIIIVDQTKDQEIIYKNDIYFKSLKIEFCI